VLYGLTHEMTPEQAGILGSYASAKIVTGMGPRLKDSLADQIGAILNGAHPLG
jgi:sugar/nucleoside kinase (ribokinase family)